MSASAAAEREVLRSLVVGVRFLLELEAKRMAGTELSDTLMFLKGDVERYWKEWHAEYDASQPASVSRVVPPDEETK